MKKDETIYVFKVTDVFLPEMFKPSRFTWNEPDRSKIEDVRAYFTMIVGDKLLHIFSDPFHWNVIVEGKAAVASVKLYIPNIRQFRQ